MLLQEKTIADRMARVPWRLQQKIRKNIAFKLGVDCDWVRRVFKDNGFMMLLCKYQAALLEATSTEEDAWINPNTILILNEDTFRYRLIEPVEELEKEGVAA